MITHDYSVALDSYKRHYPDSPFFKTWVPREKFISAEFDSQGNIAISREDDGIYGIGLGLHPQISADWKNFSIESRGIGNLPEGFKAVAEWDAYWAPTITGGSTRSLAVDDAEIKTFLESHAPHSSVFPGNDEIKKWITVHNGEILVAVAALCRWESGFLVVSSVATHSEYRGQGYGKQVMQDALTTAKALGADELSLGVMHSNTSAQALYRSLGFRLMHNFTYCERR